MYVKQARKTSENTAEKLLFRNEKPLFFWYNISEVIVFRQEMYSDIKGEKNDETGI